MGTETSLFGLYKPDDGELGSVWTDEIENNFELVEAIFTTRIQIHNGDIQTHNGQVQFY